MQSQSDVEQAHYNAVGKVVYFRSTIASLKVTHITGSRSGTMHWTDT